MSELRPEPVVDAFIEGDTEDRILRLLQKRGLLRCQIEVRNQKGGKDEKREALKLRLRAWFEIPEAVRSPLALLVLRDQDDHDPKSIVDSIQGMLRSYMDKAELRPHPEHNGVFLLTSPSPKLRLALHISRCDRVCEFFPSICKHAMDDYILALAMLKTTAEKILNERHESRRVLGVDRLLDKVQKEIPALLANNGLSPFTIAKDHISFYAALLGLPSSPPVFADVVVRHAHESDIRSHFASLIGAVAHFQ